MNTFGKKLFFPVLLFIILLSVFFRLIYLDRVPNAISGDELTYVFTATSSQLTGTDIYGAWSPWQGFIFRYPQGEHQAELPYFIVMPFVGAFGNSLFWIRFPFALMGTLVVLLMYFVTKRLFGQTTGLVAALLASINPWFIYMSRTTYEMIPATLFFLTSLYFMLDKETKRVYVAIPFLVLAFYSYIGTKLIFFPFILGVTGYATLTSKKRKLTKPYLTLILTGVLLVGFFIFMQTRTGGSRIGELFLPNDDSIQQTVNLVRTSTIQNPLLPIVVNKGTMYVWTLIGKTFSVVSPSYIFFEGDLFFSLWHGFLYPIDFIFVFIGLVSLFAKKKHLGYFFLFLLLLSVVPQVFHKNQGNFSSHTTLFVPFLIIMSAYGCTEFIEAFRKKTVTRIVASILVTLYLAFFINFFHTYFFRSQLSQNTEFDIRTLSHYIKLASASGTEIFVISPVPSDLFKKYLFYTHALQKDSILDLQQSFIQKNYSTVSVAFLPCESILPQSSVPATLIIHNECKTNLTNDTFVNIPRLIDGGSRYKIYNDQICSHEALKPYPFGITLEDFNIEELSVTQFCETFITKFY